MNENTDKTDMTENRKCPVDRMNCPCGCECKRCGKYFEFLVKELQGFLFGRD